MASASSRGTPRPSSYIKPRLCCARPKPCSAANRNQRAASTPFSRTPSPVAYTRPRLTCASASPASALVRISSMDSCCAPSGTLNASRSTTATRPALRRVITVLAYLSPEDGSTGFMSSFRSLIWGSLGDHRADFAALCCVTVCLIERRYP